MLFDIGFNYRIDGHIVHGGHYPVEADTPEEATLAISETLRGIQMKDHGWFDGRNLELGPPQRMIDDDHVWDETVDLLRSMNPELLEELLAEVRSV